MSIKGIELVKTRIYQMSIKGILVKREYIKCHRA